MSKAKPNPSLHPDDLAHLQEFKSRFIEFLAEQGIDNYVVVLQHQSSHRPGVQFSICYMDVTDEQAEYQLMNALANGLGELSTQRQTELIQRTGFQPQHGTA